MSLFNPQELKATIKRHEGLVLGVYLCPTGYKTIGYGYLAERGK